MTSPGCTPDTHWATTGSAYNSRAQKATKTGSAVWVVVWEPFCRTAGALGWSPESAQPQPESRSLRVADGVHLPERRDELTRAELDAAMTDVGWLAELLDRRSPDSGAYQPGPA